MTAAERREQVQRLLAIMLANQPTEATRETGSRLATEFCRGYDDGQTERYDAKEVQHG